MAVTPTIQTLQDGRKYFDIPQGFQSTRQNECVVAFNGAEAGADIVLPAEVEAFFGVRIVQLLGEWEVSVNIENRRQATNAARTHWKVPTNRAGEFAGCRVYFQDEVIASTADMEIPTNPDGSPQAGAPEYALKYRFPLTKAAHSKTATLSLSNTLLRTNAAQNEPPELQVEVWKYEVVEGSDPIEYKWKTAEPVVVAEDNETLLFCWGYELEVEEEFGVVIC